MSQSPIRTGGFTLHCIPSNLLRLFRLNAKKKRKNAAATDLSQYPICLTRTTQWSAHQSAPWPEESSKRLSWSNLSSNSSRKQASLWFTSHAHGYF